MEIMSCSGLKIGYDSVAVAGEISFSLEEGDYLCIVGENGSGKSTLLSTLVGVLPKVGGDFKLNCDCIGYTPQRTVVQSDFPATVIEVVLTGVKCNGFLHKFHTKEDKKKAEYWLGRVGASDLRDKCFRELSGGQQQRVLIARSLCLSEKLVILDEPIAGLDPESIESMYKLIKELNDNGVTIVMVTHDVQSAIPYCNKVLVFYENSSVVFADTKDTELVDGKVIVKY